MHAVGELTARGQGEVIGELGTATRMHRSGMSAAESFRRMAEITPESYCARTYKLLASSEEMGVDLAAGLRALADDARRARREALPAIRRQEALGDADSHHRHPGAGDAAVRGRSSPAIGSWLEINAGLRKGK